MRFLNIIEMFMHRWGREFRFLLSRSVGSGADVEAVIDTRQPCKYWQAERAHERQTCVRVCLPLPKLL